MSPLSLSRISIVSHFPERTYPPSCRNSRYNLVGLPRCLRQPAYHCFCRILLPPIISQILQRLRTTRHRETYIAESLFRVSRCCLSSGSETQSQCRLHDLWRQVLHPVRLVLIYGCPVAVIS